MASAFSKRQNQNTLSSSTECCSVREDTYNGHIHSRRDWTRDKHNKTD